MFSSQNFTSKIKRIINRIAFSNSHDYWVKRYKKGGNSGTGSYGHLAEFKGKVIEGFVKEKNVKNVIEFGSGDGNLLKYMDLPEYLGFDISEKAIENCKNLYRGDDRKKFKLVDEYQNEQAELVLSLDVIFHLIEDQVFEAYMNRLFSSSYKYVIIYSSNTDLNPTIHAPHFKHRAFSNWVEEKFPMFKLVDKIPNKYPFDGTENTSVSDFYFYEK